MDLNWTAADFGVPQPGYHLVTVGEAKEGRSQKGDAYLNLRLDVKDGERLCYDILMCQGKGLSIGLAKLKALGVKEGSPRINPQELVGRRVWVYTDFEEYQGKTSLKVKTTFQPFSCGYWNEASPPPEAEKNDGQAHLDDASVPF